MTIFNLLTLVFGISLFLFGMNLMGDTLKKSAGGKLKLFLERVTAKPAMGFLLGLLVTAIIQSSSATTVMVVGFVNSGAMLLSQAVGVIMGANVGTAITSWITALSGLENGSAVGEVMQWFKPSTFTPIIALIGVLLYLVGKNNRRKNIGLILLGFSVLMVGMDTMSNAVSVLKENEAFRSILLLFENPILGVLAGLVLTAIIQSSSASIGILQSFTVTGAITFGNAVPIIMGQNIGTCVTAMLASAGASKNAKRASFVHLSFNVIGAITGLGVFYVLKYWVGLELLNGSIDMWGIATVHTLFNLLTLLVLFPFSKQLEQIAIFFIREKPGKDSFRELDERLLETPSVALERSRMLTLRMAELSMEAIYTACSLLTVSYSEKKAEKIQRNEIAIDEYEDKLGTYLVKISEKSILEEESREISELLHMLGDLERISDHAVNLVESAIEIKDKKIVFSAEEKEELTVLTDAICEITAISFAALREQDGRKAEWVEPLEAVVDDLRNEIKHRYITRLRNNTRTMEQGFVLNDILTDLERAADHCSNIAGCLMERNTERGLELHHSLQKYRRNREVFDSRKQFFTEKYRLPAEK